MDSSYQWWNYIFANFFIFLSQIHPTLKDIVCLSSIRSRPKSQIESISSSSGGGAKTQQNRKHRKGVEGGVTAPSAGQNSIHSHNIRERTVRNSDSRSPYPFEQKVTAPQIWSCRTPVLASPISSSLVLCYGFSSVVITMTIALMIMDFSLLNILK